MIHGKQRQGGAASRAHNGDEARGKGYREGGCAPWGDIGGGGQEQEWKEGRQARRAKKFGVAEW